MAHCADHMEGVQSFQEWDTIQKAGIKLLAQIFELKPTLSCLKKRFLSGIARITYPPPPWPQFGQLGPLFSEVEIQDLKVSLELRILYILYNILYICNLKNS